MRIICISTTIIFFAFFGFIEISAAQEYTIKIASQLDSLYEARNYDALETFALRSLMLSDSLTTAERAILHKYLGLFYVIKGREPEGKKQFAQWLELDPAGYIDRFNYPPMIVRVYKEVKAEIESNKNLQPSVSGEKWEPQTSSIIKSTFVPGWGQLTQHKNKKAFLFFISQTVSITGLIISAHNLVIANTNYQRETDVDRFDELYDKANNWNYARWFFALSSAAVYVLAQADFYLLPPQTNFSSYPTTSQIDLPARAPQGSPQIYSLTIFTVHF